MDITLFTGFLLVSITLSCTPGADWAYIISSAIGPRGYVAAVWGLVSGYLFHTALLACGVAALVASSPQVLLWLTAAGSLYLLWLGIATLRSWKSAKFYDGDENSVEQPAPESSSATDTLSTNSSATTLLLDSKVRTQRIPGSWRAPFFKGLLTSGINPKALLLYLALIPQFLQDSAPWSLLTQTVALGLTHFVVTTFVYFAVAYTARLLLRTRPMAARIVTICSGSIMICLSLALIAEQFLVQ